MLKISWRSVVCFSAAKRFASSSIALARFGDLPIPKIVIPPHSDAINGNSPMRNAHIEHIEKHDRIAWQRNTGYNERSRVEAQIGRHKSVISSELRSRKLEI